MRRSLSNLLAQSPLRRELFSFIPSFPHFLIPPLLLLCSAPPPARAQDEATIGALAAVLAAEDARDFDGGPFRESVQSPEPLVRRTAALAIGRIRDLRGTNLLLPLLVDPDSTVQTAAAFGLGLLADTAAIGPIRQRLEDPAPFAPEAVAETITALARTGGLAVAAFFEDILSGGALASWPDRSVLVNQTLSESWRLGPDAPIGRLLPFADDTNPVRRTRALYTLGRLHPPAVADRLLAALRDGSPFVRAVAARALTRAYADTAHLRADAVVRALKQATADGDPGVRVNALRSLGTFPVTDGVGKLAALIDDPFPNVAVQAVTFLGQVGGPEAVTELTRLLKGKAPFAERREALVGLAHADTTAFLAEQRKWSGSTDWRERAAAGEAWEQFSSGPRLGKPDFLEDPDGRVVGATLQAWSGAVEGPSPPLVEAGRRLLGHPDAAVRSIAADLLARAAEPADVVPLAEMYRRTANDSFPDPALSALAALAAIANASDPGHQRVSREFLSAVPRPADYLQRRWAEEHWPDLAERWGPAYPIATGRSLEDYRDVVRRILLPKGPDHSARVVVETSRLEPVQLELFGGDAPMTVANFLLLVDRHFFDRHRWHRVVPNFVVQDGDPRGDGWGGPGGVIRDEINPQRYAAGVVGMALSGPDTGSSQWFITLSPQPHLDGSYTVFGRVLGNTVALNRIVQGDLIKMIHR